MNKLLLLIFCAMIAASCKSPNSGLVDSNTYLNNMTFDNGSDPSLNGWIYGRSDMDSTAHFSADVPPGSSGKWSLALNPGWLPTTEFAYRNFTGLVSGIYKLTFWGKILGRSGGGGALITKNPIQTLNLLTSATVSDTIWKQITLLDTLTLTPYDTTHVIFTGGSTEIATWTVLYNNITFEKLP